MFNGPFAGGYVIANPVPTGIAGMLGGLITRIAGAGASRPAIGLITWADLGVAAFFVVLAVLVHVVAGLLVHHNAPPPASPPAAAAAAGTGVAPRSHALRILGAPLYVMIWGYALYAALTPLLLKLIPPNDHPALQSACDTLLNVGTFVVIIWLIYRLTRVLEMWLDYWGVRAPSHANEVVLPLLGRSLRVMMPVLGVIFALPLLDLPPRYDTVVGRGTSILFIAAVAVVLFRAARVVEQSMLARYDLKAADNLRARKIYTQVRIMGRVIDVIIAIFTLASVLMLFAEVRQIGTSVLASAGIVGIIAGVAAQKTLGNLFAGFQIALAQPLRQDDVLVVEGEWGRVEEITLTYVVVHIWDDRRLVLPLSYFIEKPFQNWTRTSAQLLGSVIIWVDYSFPVEEARVLLKGIVEGSPRWDKRFWNLQVSDTSEHCIQLRVLATAADSSTSWDLRCEIREKFIAAIQGRWPQALPRLRTELPGAAKTQAQAPAKMPLPA